MAQSVPMAASSEQGRNYKSELAYARRRVSRRTTRVNARQLLPQAKQPLPERLERA